MAKAAKRGEALCPNCREPSPADAVICPACKLTFTQAQRESRQQASAYATEAPKADGKATTVGCIGLVSVVLLLATCIGGDKKDKDAPAATAGAAASPEAAKGDAIATYKAVIVATASCDAASSAMSNVMQSGDVVQAYRAADRAEEACLGTGSKIRAIDVPDNLSKEHRTAIEDALEACDTGYVMKWAGARKLKAIIDGDNRPSDLAELQDTTDQMQRAQLLCVGGLVSVATALGATEKDLGIDTKK